MGIKGYALVCEKCLAKTNLGRQKWEEPSVGGIIGGSVCEVCGEKAEHWRWTPENYLCGDAAFFVECHRACAELEREIK